MTQTRGRSSRSSKRLDSRYSNNSDGQSNCSNDINSITNQNETEQVDEPTIGHIKRDEDESHAVTVLVSLEDSFTLNQVWMPQATSLLITGRMEDKTDNLVPGLLVFCVSPVRIADKQIKPELFACHKNLVIETLCLKQFFFVCLSQRTCA